MKNLKKIIRTDAAFEILDNSNCSGTDWGSGGCGILAQAINKLSGYPIYVIYNKKFQSAEHFGVQTPSGKFLDHDGEHENAKAWLSFFKENEMPRDGELVVIPYTKEVDKSGINFDDKAAEELAELIKRNGLVREFVRKVLVKSLMTEAFDSEYKSWKRKNVTIRGVKEAGEENNAGAMLGRGLYTAALSNKGLAKQYGDVYFVVGAIPKNPKVFNTLNEWEIWFYNTLVYEFSKEQGKEFPDKRDFNAKTTIEDELQKMGYDGIIIKGREMVNFSPGDVMYFRNEQQLFDYYNTSIRGRENLKEEIVGEEAFRAGHLPAETALFTREINQGYDLVLYNPKTKNVYAAITAIQRDYHGNDYFVTAVAAEKGFGPFIYELAMMHLNRKKGVGIMPARDGDVRESAFNVWEKFYNRNDVDKTTFDLLDDKFRCDILFGDECGFEDGEDKQSWWSELSPQDKQTLLVFNTAYSLTPDEHYKELVLKAKKWESNGFDAQNAIDAGAEMWDELY